MEHQIIRLSTDHLYLIDISSVGFQYISIYIDMFSRGD